MPTYEYKCDDCGFKFELFHSVSSKPELNCEKCNSKKIRSVITGGAGFILKGSGFYSTDYKKKEITCPKSNTCENASACPSAGEK